MRGAESGQEKNKKPEKIRKAIFQEWEGVELPVVVKSRAVGPLFQELQSVWSHRALEAHLFLTESSVQTVAGSAQILLASTRTGVCPPPRAMLPVL